MTSLLDLTHGIFSLTRAGINRTSTKHFKNCPK